MIEEVTQLSGIKVLIREPQPEDINFILSTMLKGLFYGSKFYGSIDQETFFLVYEPFIKQLLINNFVKVACLEDDVDVILGYSVFKNTNLQFIFVKKSYRKLGIGRLLFPKEIQTVSHLTDVGDSIRKKLNLKFNPFDTGA
jgi:hypothetical protein